MNQAGFMAMMDMFMMKYRDITRVEGTIEAVCLPILVYHAIIAITTRLL